MARRSCEGLNFSADFAGGAVSKFRLLAASNLSLSAKFDYLPCVSRAFGVSLRGGVEAIK
nr:hypothetical protein [uncultured Campylobacter sp.]